MGELRKEFETLIDVKLDVSEKAPDGRLTSLSDTNTLNELRMELEKVISDRGKEYGNNFVNIFKTLSDIELRSNEDTGKQIAALRS